MLCNKDQRKFPALSNMVSSIVKSSFYCKLTRAHCTDVFFSCAKLYDNNYGSDA